MGRFVHLVFFIVCLRVPVFKLLSSFYITKFCNKYYLTLKILKVNNSRVVSLVSTLFYDE